MTLDELNGASNRSLLLVHGRDFKPAEDVHMELSMAALRSGIERDFPDSLQAFDAMGKTVLYYLRTSDFSFEAKRISSKHPFSLRRADVLVFQGVMSVTFWEENLKKLGAVVISVFLLSCNLYTGSFAKNGGKPPANINATKHSPRFVVTTNPETFQQNI